MSNACPICSKPVDPAFRPFCSKRCSDVDLQRWLSERYVVPATDDEGVNPGSGDIYRNDD
ncbi:DNA gyrase inhibitor YacG [Caulobacter henricii]|uniref:DNA gyrase inhibitor YacG n=1 Tax=Caulobacter henricii TaxID=69395 RepID=A0A0N7JHB0_9CAUL|nr:DNA gyrase inhibitor YacG [Caulobacter henricii]ALL12890.1 DNA gyrase inhibitor [Caulobacter henricii]